MRFPLSLTSSMVGYIAKKKITGEKRFPRDRVPGRFAVQQSASCAAQFEHHRDVTVRPDVGWIGNECVSASRKQRRDAKEREEKDGQGRPEQWPPGHKRAREFSQ